MVFFQSLYLLDCYNNTLKEGWCLVRHWNALLAEMYAKHGGGAGEGVGHRVLVEHARQELHTLVASVVCSLQCGRVGDDIQAHGGGAQGDEIASVCTTVHNAAGVVADRVHDVSTATESSDGIAVAHGLGKRGEIRIYSVQLLRASFGHTETTLDFVYQQQAAVTAAQIAQFLKPFWLC
jgi:hypothetical protein